MTTSSDIRKVLGGLFASIDDGNKDSYESVASTPAVQKAVEGVRQDSLSSFYFSLIYPLSNMVDGLLAKELPLSRDAQFLFKHSEFVESHFLALIVKFEGSACSSDKSKTVLRRLLGYLKTGEEITFDYTQEYTYHLPKRVFTDHGEITRFFAALRQLYHGNSEQFIKTVHDIYIRESPLNTAPAE